MGKKHTHKSETSESNDESVKEKIKVSHGEEENSNKKNIPQKVNHESDSEHLQITEIQESERSEVSEQSYNSNLFLEELTSDDEILTFQCPPDFSVNSLLKKRFCLNEMMTICDDSGNTFGCEVLKNEKKMLTLILPTKNIDNQSNATLMKLPVGGHMQIKKIKNDTVKVRPKGLVKKVKFPTDLTIRHPMLGTSWRQHLDEAKKEIAKNKRKQKKSTKHEKKLLESGARKRKSILNDLTPHKKRKLS